MYFQVECRVCNDVFSLQGDRVPRLLFCGHTVCHQCLTRLPLHGTTLLCPFDRQPTQLADSGVWGLKKNFALIELLERLQQGSGGRAGGGYSWDPDTIENEKEVFAMIVTPMYVYLRCYLYCRFLLFT